MLIPLLAFVPLVTGPVIEATPADAPPIQLWINSDRRFRVGERVKIQVETGMSGYLLVLQLDTDGTLRVLFPLGPADETFVEGGRRFEVRDPRSGESFVADHDGVGLIYTAIAADPYRFDAWLDSDGNWSPAVLTVARETEDPEADLSALVQQLVSPAGFDYDVLDYLVMGRRSRYVENAPPPPGWWSPLWDEYYDYCYSCAGYSGVYVSLGYGGWYWPSYWYRPWYYSYYGLHGYYPGYWGYDWGYRGGYRGRITVRPRGNVPVIVGRPRGYDVGHLGDRARPSGNRGSDAARGRSGNAPAARPTRQAGGSNDRPRARPVTQEGTRSGGQAVSRPSGGQSSGSKPAARPRPRPRPDAATTQASTRSSRPDQSVSVTRSRPDSRSQGSVRVPTRATTRTTTPAAPTARRARTESSNRSVRISSRNTSRAVVRTSPSTRTSSARVSAPRSSTRSAPNTRARAATRVGMPSYRGSASSVSRSATRSAPSRASVNRSPSGGRSSARSSGGSARSRPRPKN